MCFWQCLCPGMAISDTASSARRCVLHRMRPSGITIGAAPFRTRRAEFRLRRGGAGLTAGTIFRAARRVHALVASTASSAASIAPPVFALPSLSMRARFVTGLSSSARSFSPLDVCPRSPLLVCPRPSGRPAGEVFHFSSDAFALAGAASGSVRVVVISF